MARRLSRRRKSRSPRKRYQPMVTLVCRIKKRKSKSKRRKSKKRSRSRRRLNDGCCGSKPVEDGCADGDDVW